VFIYILHTHVREKANTVGTGARFSFGCRPLCWRSCVVSQYATLTHLLKRVDELFKSSPLLRAFRTSMAYTDSFLILEHQYTVANTKKLHFLARRPCLSLTQVLT